jgi:hypothetical protein
MFVAAAVLVFVPLPQARLASAVLGLLGAVTDAGAEHLEGLADDPPDPQFREVARPVFRKLRPLPVVPDSAVPGSTAAHRALFQRLIRKSDAVSAYLRAILTSMERAEAARLAADLTWTTRHLEAIASYSRAATDELEVLDDLLPDTQWTLRRYAEVISFGSNSFGPSRAQVARAQAQLAKGLPSPANALLARAGLTPTERENFRRTVLSGSAAPNSVTTAFIRLRESWMQLRNSLSVLAQRSVEICRVIRSGPCVQ